MRAILCVLLGLSLTACGLRDRLTGDDGDSGSDTDGGGGGGGGDGGGGGGDLSTNADLAGLGTSDGSLTPGFEAGQLGYGVEVGCLVSAATLTPTVADAGATVTVAGQPVASGSASDPVDVGPGFTPIDVQVTAADGTTVKTYVVVFYRTGEYEQQAFLKRDPVVPKARFGSAMALSGDTLVVGAEGTYEFDFDTFEYVESPGSARVYVRSGGAWSPEATLLLGARVQSVAIDGDTLVLGVPSDASGATGIDGDSSDDSAPNAGAAHVFVRSAGTWSLEAYLKGSNTAAGDMFGYGVAISGDTVVVGAIGEDGGAVGVDGAQDDESMDQAGAAYAFVRVDGSWSQQAYLKASNTDSSDQFGETIALDGDTLVIGARFESSAAAGVDGDQDDDSLFAAGAAYVFVRSEGTWSQQTYLKASNPGTSDTFGAALAIEGDTIVVGAPLESSSATGVDGDGSNDDVGGSGAAYVFTRAGTTWAQEAYVKAAEMENFALFGTAVALHGDMLVVGAPLSRDTGSARVFVRESGVFAEQAIVLATYGRSGDYFGSSVAVGDRVIAVGAPQQASSSASSQLDDFTPRAGAAYLFR